jgi:hypothetical protein
VQHTVIDGTDFGVAVSALRDDADLYLVPVGVIDARADTPPPAQPPEPPPPPPGAALAAVQAEVDQTGVRFTFDGETYFVQAADEWPVEVFEAAEAGKFVTSVKELLGAAQWRRFKAKRRVSRDVESIFVAAQQALGTKSR